MSIFSRPSQLGGKLLARNKARLDAEKNRRRLDEASLVSRKLGALRIPDRELKPLAARLVYEADAYLAAAKESPGALYDPPALDALEEALGALNFFLKESNHAAAEKYLPLGGILVPQEAPASEAAIEDAAGDASTRGASVQRPGPKEDALLLLQESLRRFTELNGLRRAGDYDAARIDLART
jgi:hypothetical protein